jgi:annexin A7/11
MKGFGTNEKELIRVLSKADAIQINVMREQYQRRYHTDLIKHLEKETSGNFEAALVHVARGPLLGDCYALKRAMKGVGTNEDVLTDVLTSRTNADLNAIKAEYRKQFGTTLEADLRSDLSSDTEGMFIMIAAAKRHEDSDPVLPANIEADVKNLQDAFGNFMTKNGIKISEIITSRNEAQIRAIAQSYEQRYGRSLATTINKAFTGHMKDTLLLFVARAQNRALSDAVQLEDTMKGVGTKVCILSLPLYPVFEAPLTELCRTRF